VTARAEPGYENTNRNFENNTVFANGRMIVLKDDLKLGLWACLSSTTVLI
jgi:hypothetical protein